MRGIALSYTICFDFGSTYTKMAVLDLDSAEAVMTYRVPSTVKTDAMEGVKQDLREAEKVIGLTGVRGARFLASSSAAGGLRMVVVGLTDKYSLIAGLNTALGAGARVIRSFSGLLTSDDLREIERLQPSILLVCGGTDNGNTDRIWHNAKVLTSGNVSLCPVIYAGNSGIAEEVRALFLQKGMECYVTDNLFPSLDRIHAGPAQNVIHNIFMKRITGMKGLSTVQKTIGNIVMPTPAAVLRAGNLIAEGPDTGSEKTPCMIFDVGGATTDVYSFSDYKADGVKIFGAPEPFARRTVEGDLGLRSSAVSLYEQTKQEIMADSHFSGREEKVLGMCRMRTEKESYIPDSEEERLLDKRLAQAAVYTAARRHAGRIENAWTKGAGEVQSGKDLTKVHTVIGTGGPVIFRADPSAVLTKALRTPEERDVLLPLKANFYLDRKYLLYAVGLCAKKHPKEAYAIAIKNLEETGGGDYA